MAGFLVLTKFVIGVVFGTGAWADWLELHSNYAWRIPWTEEPGGIQSMGSQRVRHDWSDFECTHALITKASLIGPNHPWLAHCEPRGFCRGDEAHSIAPKETSLCFLIIPYSWSCFGNSSLSTWGFLFALFPLSSLHLYLDSGLTFRLFTFRSETF